MDRISDTWPRTLLECPLVDCAWVLWQAVPGQVEVKSSGSTGGINKWVKEMLAATVAVDDEACRAHMRDHSLEDFLRTIAALRQQIEELVESNPFGKTHPTSIFSRRDGHALQAYNFAMPGILISGLDMPVEFKEGRWRVTQLNMAGGPVTGVNESLWAAVMTLIARRMGFEAQFVPVVEE